MCDPRLLLTRPAPQSRSFAEAVRARFGTDFGAIVAPVLRIEFLPLTRDPAGFDALVFTSRNGVAAFAAASALRDRPAWCVGDATARAATESGLAAQSVSGTLADLADRLRREPGDTRLLHPRGRHVAGDLGALIGPDGPSVAEAVVYEQREIPLNTDAQTLLHGDVPVLLPLFSPRSATLVGPAIAAAQAEMHVAAMSPAVVRVLPVQARARLVTAPQPDADGMLQALAALLAKLKPA